MTQKVLTSAAMPVVWLRETLVLFLLALPQAAPQLECALGTHGLPGVHAFLNCSVLP